MTLEPNRDPSGERTEGFHAKTPKVFFNYFGKDRVIHLWLANKRTKLIGMIVPAFLRVGLVPDTISYVGIALLAGVILYFVRNPLVACLFLAGHILCDGMDGAYARYTGKASQSGAFTDLVCDQLGMVVVAMMAIFHHMVSPLIGTVYIALYLIVVVFGVIINVMGLQARITITSKFFLYAVYGIWASWGVNYIPLLMYFFSGVMAIEVIVGYWRLKRGIRRKFDTEVRFTEGDPYTGKLNYVLNVAVPVLVLALIFVGANQIPLRAMFDVPKLRVAWTEGPKVVEDDEETTILGLGVRDRSLLVLMRGPDEILELKRFNVGESRTGESFVLPEYVVPVFSSLPVDGHVLLVADGTTRLLMGIDLDASFAAKRAVTVFTLPLGYLRITAAAITHWKGTKVWLMANYLYTRKTYMVDPGEALRKGYVLGGEEARYINGAFPSGMVVHDEMVFEFDKSPLQALIYVASLKRLLGGASLLDAATVSFTPPARDAVGPILDGDDLVMLSPAGRIYRLPVQSVMGKTSEQKPAKTP